jgi:ABC-type transport system involved in multi-copper enzyme maturation permease subunit
MAVFFYDLLRTSRRGRLALLRSCYALVMLAALATLHARWFSDTPARGRIRPDATAEMARFAEQFAGSFLFIQMGAVLLLTPALAAGAIVEERQRGTLALLLTTHLTPRQIVLGKFASRAVYMFGVLLTGLPVLALLPLWGGVAPELILTGFGMTVAGVLSLSAVSVWCSAGAESGRGAVLGAYVVAGVSCLFPPLCICLNPFVAMAAAFEGVTPVSWLYIGCHLLWTAWLIPAAARALPLRDTPPSRRPARPVVPAAPIVSVDRESDAVGQYRHYSPPPVGNRPLLWKEVHFAGSDAARFFSRLLMFTALSLALLILPILDSSRSGAYAFYNIVQILLVVLLAAAVITTMLHATGSIAREREQRTLDVLLSIPGGREELLRAKWFGSILYARGLLIGLFVLLLVGVVVFDLSPLAVPLFALSAGSHLAFTASLGMLLSVTVRSTARAGFIGAAILLLVCVVPAAMCPFGDMWSPPVTWLHSLPSTYGILDKVEGGGALSVPFGVTPYAGLAAGLWYLARQRFLQEGDEPAMGP